MGVCSVMISLKAGSISCSSVSSQYLLEHLALCTCSKNVMMDEHTAGEQSSKGQYHFFLRLFLCGPFLKSSLNLVQYCFMFCFFFWQRGMWDLNSLTRDRTCIPCTARQSLSHWTTREVPKGWYHDRYSLFPGSQAEGGTWDES